LFYENGNKKAEMYYSNDSLQRNNNYGPTMTEYYENGKVREEKYYHDGLLHRLYAPAKYFIL
jgi:antitoxin component YwqK of YwqJK toxin-antitoxin module